MEQPPRRSLRKPTSSTTPNPLSQPEPLQDNDLAVTDDDIQARSIRRTTRESDYGVAAQVAGTAVGAVESVFTRLLKLARLPISIIVALVVVYWVGGGLGLILGIVTAFVVSVVLSALVGWLEMRAYRRKMR